MRIKRLEVGPEKVRRVHPVRSERLQRLVDLRWINSGNPSDRNRIGRQRAKRRAQRRQRIAADRSWRGEHRRRHPGQYLTLVQPLLNEPGMRINAAIKQTLLSGDFLAVEANPDRGRNDDSDQSYNADRYPESQPAISIRVRRVRRDGQRPFDLVRPHPKVADRSNGSTQSCSGHKERTCGRDAQADRRCNPQPAVKHEMRACRSTLRRGNVMVTMRWSTPYLARRLDDQLQLADLVVERNLVAGRATGEAALRAQCELLERTEA